MPSKADLSLRGMFYLGVQDNKGEAVGILREKIHKAAFGADRKIRCVALSFLHRSIRLGKVQKEQERSTRPITSFSLA